MKKNVLFTAFILLSTTIFGQTINSGNNFNLGVAAFQAGNYQSALTYFNESLNEIRTTNCIVNRAITYYYLGDTCRFCDDLNMAYRMGDTIASKLYKGNCGTSKTVYDIPESIKSTHHYAEYMEITNHKCDSDSTTMLFLKDAGQTWSEDISSIYGEVYTIVEIMPEFPGGAESINRYLAQNIIYPKLAAQNGIEGIVYVSFVVDKMGDVRNVRILRGIGGGCDEELVRVVKLMPRWKPGTQNEKPVNVLYNMPFIYSLSNPKKSDTRK
jgi:TonB family protein